MHYSLKDRVKASVRSSKQAVFLRSDFDHLGDYRQVSRVLGELQKEKVIERVGYGLYTRPAQGTQLEEIIPQVRSRLGRRVHRSVTINGSTVRLGQKAKQIRNAQTKLDDFKLRLARAVVEKFPLSLIRQKSLMNLDRWKANDVWCTAHDEWRALMQRGSDKDVVAVMCGDDERSNRLRQSPPYTGLLDKNTLEQIRETSPA